MPSVEAPKETQVVDEKANTNNLQQSKDVAGDPSAIPEDVVDPSTFDQILEMDDDDEREFSRAIVFGFFDQAEDTFRQMEESVYVFPGTFYGGFIGKARDLSQLSSLGHFLKGSSATLGLTKVKDSCEKIQHLGVKKDETGLADITDESLCLEKIKKTLDIMKKDYTQAEKHLAKFYGEPTDEP